jgi:hypothetical protein
MTMGSVRVARFSARAAGVAVPTTTSTPRRVSSSACWTKSTGVSAYRSSMTRFSLDIAEFAKTLPEHSDKGCCCGRGAGDQDANAVDLCRLLRPGGQRRSEGAPTHKRADESSPVHHRMISSARTSRDCGMVRPRALAVFRLMISENLLGCSTGSSPGFAPLWI